MQIITHFYDFAFGRLMLASYNEQLCICDWVYRAKRQEVDHRIRSGLNAEFIEGTSDVIELTKFQLVEYLARKRKTFALPLLFVGTDFQKDVWQELIKIPYGKTVSYQKLSQLLHNEAAIRAVAAANGANAISIIVPCHRVIGSHGDLTGYAGGLDAKKKLIELEGSERQGELF